MAILNFINETIDSVKSGITTIKSKAVGAVSVVDPKLGRLLASGLDSVIPSDNSFQSFNSKISYSGTTEQEDWRVRLSLAENADILYRSSNAGDILSPLIETNGIIFPYTPAIEVVNMASYGESPVTHTNYSFYSYEKSLVQNITINAEFTAQTPEEARYLLAVIHFLRSASKMFTLQDRYAGNPPPLLFLKGYGDYTLPNVPCVIEQFSQSYPNDVDYISTQSMFGEMTTSVIGNCSIDAAGSQTRVPTHMSLSIVLKPIYSRSKVSNFSLESFARGEYVGRGYM